jgi:hypothetical protein
MGRMTVPISLRLGKSRWVALPVLLGLLFGAGLRSAHAQADGTPEGPLPARSNDIERAHFINNDTIIRMSRAGLDDTVIVQTIQTQPGHYDTSPDDLITLKNAGVSQNVIAAMQARGAGLAIRSAAPSVDPAPLAAGIDEIGVYYKTKTGDWVPLKTERVEFKSGGWAKSAFTHNIVKQDLNGFVDGPQSPLVLFAGAEILIYAPAGTQPEEYDFVQFRLHSKGREFRVQTGGVFHSETGSKRDDIDFQAHRIAPQMYVFTVPPDIVKGEYGVLPPGAAANMRGLSNAGKIFTFSIRE